MAGRGGNVNIDIIRLKYHLSAIKMLRFCQWLLWILSQPKFASTGLFVNTFKPSFLSEIMAKYQDARAYNTKFSLRILEYVPTAKYQDRYQLGEISALCLHFAGSLSIAMTDFI